MPSVSPPLSKNARAVHEKHLDLLGKYSHHQTAVESFQQLARGQVLDDVTAELELNEEGRARAALYLDDFANLFRFYRRTRYSVEQATALLKASLLWRIRTDLDLLSLSSLHPLYVSPPPPTRPLFWVNSTFKDFYGRPCGLITLRSIERTAENSLDELKEYIVGCMEIIRRYVGDLYRASSSDQSLEEDVSESTVLQMTIAVDLAGSGMANLELELLPFLLDLLKNHVPGMVGAVYILNYGWIHAGMWAVIKRVLPQQALAKIFFLSEEELQEHFAVERIPKAFKGELDLEIDSTSNDVLRRYGRPRRTGVAPQDSLDAVKAHTSSSMSRTNSYDSIYEVFYSADSTPWASRSMTPRHSEPSTPRGTPDQNSNAFKMTPSAARKLKHLQMSRGDLSSAAEHAQDPETRVAGRLRADSNPRIENGHALGLHVNVGHSPHTTPFMTPAGPLSPRTPRSKNADRHVRFSSPRARSLSPPRRIGASSSFKLYLPQDDDEAVLPSESEESDSSGKDGEKPTETDQSSGILSRLRRLSETRRSPKPRIKRADKEKEDGTLMYIEPGSPQLQVPHLEEAPLQNVPHTFLSHRTRRAGRDGHVSPYHANNPYFGYPAYIDDTTSHGQPKVISPTKEHGGINGVFSLASQTTPRHLHVRRRKRDLLRTLTYLFVLRILAFHRRVRWRAALIYREAARTISVGGRSGLSSSDDGDDFWRNLDARRLSSTFTPATDKSKHQGTQHLTRMSTALLLILLVRPQWRKNAMTRVYMMLAPSLLRSDETREPPNWDDWDGRVKPTTSQVGKSDSWTGLHVRKRLGLTSANKSTGNSAVVDAGNGGGSRSGRGQRYNPMALAGGLLAAASLSYLLYNYLNSTSQGYKGDGDDDDDVVNRRGVTASTSTAEKKSRPSMSLCLSTSFDRSSDGSMTALRRLLERISPLFVVHLIVPGDTDVNLAESIASLAATLDDISDFDTRRILEYTQLSGRFALSRALACDCHVEISLPASDESATTHELEKIRRSCGLVVFAALPTHKDDGTPEQVNTQAIQVLEQFKRMASEAGQPDMDAPHGVRAYRSPSWSHLATQMCTLRQGWK